MKLIAFVALTGTTEAHWKRSDEEPEFLPQPISLNNEAELLFAMKKWRYGGANGMPEAAVPSCNCKQFQVYGNNFDGIYTQEGYYNDKIRGGPTPFWAMYRKIDDDFTKRYLIFYQDNTKWWVNWELNNERRGWSYSEKTFLCPDQCDPMWQNCSGDGMQFTCLDDGGPVTTAVPPGTTAAPGTVCRNNHLYDRDFHLVDTSQIENTYQPGTEVDIKCAPGTQATLNRIKVGAVCKCCDGSGPCDENCSFVPKKEGFRCVSREVCPLPDFQGAKFNYVINSKKGDDWAYMRYLIICRIQN